MAALLAAAAAAAAATAAATFVAAAVTGLLLHRCPWGGLWWWLAAGGRTAGSTWGGLWWWLAAGSACWLLCKLLPLLLLLLRPQLLPSLLLPSLLLLLLPKGVLLLLLLPKGLLFSPSHLFLLQCQALLVQLELLPLCSKVGACVHSISSPVDVLLICDGQKAPLLPQPVLGHQPFMSPPPAPRLPDAAPHLPLKPRTQHLNVLRPPLVWGQEPLPILWQVSSLPLPAGLFITPAGLPMQGKTSSKLLCSVAVTSPEARRA